MLLLLAVLTIAGPTMAGLETDPEFKKGQEQIEAFEYEKAAAVFEAVAKRPALPDADRAVALVWLGLACAELRDQARASVAFEDAVTADPLIVLPRDASPKIKALLEDARARVRLRPKPAATTTGPANGANGANGATGANNANNANGANGATGADHGSQPQGSSLVPVAIGALVVGAVVAVAGGVVWSLGLVLRQEAIDAPFQSDAAALRDQSVATQIGGQVATGVGVAALAVGGALFAVGEME